MTSAFQIIPQRHGTQLPGNVVLPKTLLPPLSPWSFTFELNPFLRPVPPTSPPTTASPKSFSPKLLSMSPKMLQQAVTPKSSPSFSTASLLSDAPLPLAPATTTTTTNSTTSDVVPSFSDRLTQLSPPLSFPLTSSPIPASRLDSALSTQFKFPPELAELLRQPLVLDKIYSKVTETPAPTADSLDVSTLVNLSIKDLNRQLRGMNRTEVVKLKQLRRRLKNRTYAKLSRHKRVATISMLEEEISELEQELSYHSKETEKLQKSTSELNDKLNILLKFAQDRRIPLAIS